jgi:hypothetical protein
MKAAEVAAVIVAAIVGEQQMTEEDKTELAWWRQEFGQRFVTGNLPQPGTALHDARFVLMVEDPVTFALDPWTPTVG